MCALFRPPIGCSCCELQSLLFRIWHNGCTDVRSTGRFLVPAHHVMVRATRIFRSQFETGFVPFVWKAVSKLHKSIRNAVRWTDARRIIEFECYLLGLFMVEEFNFGVVKSLQVSFTDLDSDLLADNDVPDEEVIDSLNFAENSDSESDESDTETEDDPDYSPDDEDTATEVTGYFMTPLPRTAEMASRLGIGNEAVAKILTCHNMDLGSPQVVTEKKIRGQRAAVQNEAIQKRKGLSVPGIYFDGKIDKTTLERSAAGGVTRGAEDHYSVVIHYPEQTEHEEKQEGTYMGFFIPSKGTGIEIAVGLKEHCEFMELKTDTLEVIGSDGTSVNTGWENGAIVQSERILKRSLFWAICSIHRVELPLRNLIEKMDGKTTGPEEYIGPIGKLLSQDLWKLPVGNFAKIPAKDFPVVKEEVFGTFSNDVKYLYLCCLAIVNGEFPKELHQQKMGPLNHSRWFTTASRILRLYVSCTCDIPLLTRFTNYIVNVYFKTYLQIKRRNSISYGANHLLFELKNVQKHCTKEERNILVPVLQNNSYYGHPEAILLSMLADSRQFVRNRAIQLIEEIRQNPVARTVRTFLRPKLQPDADEVWKLANIKNKKDHGGRLCYLTENQGWKFVYEPSVTKGRDLNQWSDQPLVLHYPAHSQTVEHAVQTTSKCVASSLNYLDQLGQAFATVDSRRSIKGKISRKRKLLYR